MKKRERRKGRRKRECVSPCLSAMVNSAVVRGGGVCYVDRSAERSICLQPVLQGFMRFAALRGAWAWETQESTWWWHAATINGRTESAIRLTS